MNKVKILDNKVTGLKKKLENKSFLANAPKYALEFIAFTIILVFILSLVYFGETDFSEALPILAIYIFAGYKLLPIFQSIYLGLVQIKNNIPAYDKIEKEWTENFVENFEYYLLEPSSIGST